MVCEERWGLGHDGMVRPTRWGQMGTRECRQMGWAQMGWARMGTWGTWGVRELTRGIGEGIVIFQPRRVIAYNVLVG